MSANERKFKAEQVIFREGDHPNCIYIIKKGVISIRKRKPGGFVEMAKLYPKEVVGELSFFDRMPRSASAVAVDEVEVTEIDFDSLDKIYAKVPPYMKTMMAAMANRLRKANETIRRLHKGSLAGQDATEDKSGDALQEMIKEHEEQNSDSAAPSSDGESAPAAKSGEKPKP